MKLIYMDVLTNHVLFVEIAAIRNMDVLPILCYFHLMQAIDRQAKQSKHGLNIQRGMILDGIRTLKHAPTAAAFRILCKMFMSVITSVSESFAKYFRENYICATPLEHASLSSSQHSNPECLCLARRWSNFGNRADIPNRGTDETTNLAEAFFRKLKYRFLATRIHRRLSDLLMVVFEQVIPSYVLEQRMKLSVGRYPNLADQRHDTREAAVDKLIQQKSVKWSDEAVGTAVVTGSTSDYFVCLADMTCTCPYATQSNTNVVCKHMEACIMQRPQVSNDTIMHALKQLSCRQLSRNSPLSFMKRI
jgi:hypothetical protein